MGGPVHNGMLGTGAVDSRVLRDGGVVASKMSPDYLDQFVSAAVALADTGGGATDAALTVQLKRSGTGDNIVSARQVLLALDLAQYGLVPAANVSVSIVATTGAVIATIVTGALFLVQTNAAGLFAATVTNTDDEAVYASARTASGGVSVIGERCCVVGSNSDIGTWSP